MKRIFAALAILAASLAAGCHAQVPPVSSTAVSLSWTASTDAGCTGNCTITYNVYRCSQSTSACADLSNSGWALLASSPTASYSDTTAPVAVVYYNVEAVANGLNSAPSNVAQVTVTAVVVPTAPVLNAPTVAESAPAAGLPQMAMGDASRVTLVARLER